MPLFDCLKKLCTIFQRQRNDLMLIANCFNFDISITRGIRALLGVFPSLLADLQRPRDQSPGPLIVVVLADFGRGRLAAQHKIP